MTEPARLASWTMRDAPPGARRLLYIAAEGHGYRTGVRNIFILSGMAALSTEGR